MAATITSEWERAGVMIAAGLYTLLEDIMTYQGRTYAIQEAPNMPILIASADFVTTGGLDVM